MLDLIVICLALTAIVGAMLLTHDCNGARIPVRQRRTPNRQN